MPRPKQQLGLLIRKYFKASQPDHADASGPGQLESVSGRDGAPLLGDGHVYVLRNRTDYHTEWCQVVADKWDHAPKGLHVTLLADVTARTRCQKCDRIFNAARTPPGQDHTMEPEPAPAPLAPDAAIPLTVVGAAHGILFLAAGPEYQELLQQTAVEPATPLLVDGRRAGLVVRVDSARDEPLLVVQLDPRAAFRNVPYQARLRNPLLRSATKPYAVESVEPAPQA